MWTVSVYVGGVVIWGVVDSFADACAVARGMASRSDVKPHIERATSEEIRIIAAARNCVQVDGGTSVH
jgi:hypothetical protein